MSRKRVWSKTIFLFRSRSFIIASYDEDGTPCAMNAAWCGISGHTEVTMSLSPGHKTVKIILKEKSIYHQYGRCSAWVECDYF